MKRDDIVVAHEISRRLDALQGVAASLEPLQDSQVIIIVVRLPDGVSVEMPTRVGPLLRMCRHQGEDCEKSLRDFGIQL